MIVAKTESELEILREFQKKIADLNQDEATCLRFLIAREFDITKAEEMLRQSLFWRSNIQIDNYSQWTMGDLQKEFEYRVTGLSKNGGPVIWVPLGRWNARYWIERGKKEETTLYGFHILETALRKMKEANNTQVAVILGIEELTYYKVAHMDTLKVLYAAFQSLEQNYPEILQSLFIINAPWIFSIAFNFVKPILSPRTLNKFHIFGAEKEKWLPALRAVIPDESIPADYFKE